MLDDFSGKTDKRTFDAPTKLFNFLVESAFASVKFTNDYLLDGTKPAVLTWNILNVSQLINNKNPKKICTIRILLQRWE